MDVGAADNQQEVNLTRAHATQRQVQRVVPMNVWKFALIDDLAQSLLCQAIAVRALQTFQADRANRADDRQRERLCPCFHRCHCLRLRFPSLGSFLKMLLEHGSKVSPECALLLSC